MIMNCGRCGKDIDTPNKKNAKYIRNPQDQRTFGKNMVNKYSVIDDNDSSKEEFSKFKDASVRANEKFSLLDKQITDDAKLHKACGSKIKGYDIDVVTLTNELATIEDSEVVDSKVQVAKQGEINTKQSEINSEKIKEENIAEDIRISEGKKSKIRVVEEVKEEDAPKTLIVCLNCVIDGDQIIW